MQAPAKFLRKLPAAHLQTHLQYPMRTKPCVAPGPAEADCRRDQMQKRRHHYDTLCPGRTGRLQLAASSCTGKSHQCTATDLQYSNLQNHSTLPCPLVTQNIWCLVLPPHTPDQWMPQLWRHFRDRSRAFRLPLAWKSTKRRRMNIRRSLRRTVTDTSEATHHNADLALVSQFQYTVDRCTQQFSLLSRQYSTHDPTAKHTRVSSRSIRIRKRATATFGMRPQWRKQPCRRCLESPAATALASWMAAQTSRATVS